MNSRDKRVLVIGTRGPGAEGGIESHVDELVPIVCKDGWEVEVLGRSPYKNEYHPDLGSAEVTWIWAPKVHWLETIFHSFLGLAYAIKQRPRIIHVHAIGPALITPFARLLGFKVVVTHHGFDYDREKWGTFAKAIIRFGEQMGMRFANECIVISENIRDRIEAKYHRNTNLIPNGVRMPALSESRALIDEFDLESGKYILQVSRCVPEKRQLDLIDAFARAAVPGWKLVLVGDVPVEKEYGQSLVAAAQHTPNVVLAGFRKGPELVELFSHAGMFVLPSSHEGLPIVMLEALSFGLPVIASDIPSNLEVGLPKAQYFSLGDTEELASKIERQVACPRLACEFESRRQLVAEKYNWHAIAESTIDVYKKALS